VRENNQKPDQEGLKFGNVWSHLQNGHKGLMSFMIDSSPSAGGGAAAASAKAKRGCDPTFALDEGKDTLAYLGMDNDEYKRPQPRRIARHRALPLLARTQVCAATSVPSSPHLAGGRASTASNERVHSPSTRINSKLRARMLPDTLERLTMAYFYINIEVQQLTARVKNRFDDDFDVAEVDALINSDIDPADAEYAFAAAAPAAAAGAAAGGHAAAAAAATAAAANNDEVVFL